MAFWLGSHRDEIVDSAKRWHVDPRAIAGAIAWEALQNPRGWSLRGPGAGKVHSFAMPWELGILNPSNPLALQWAETVEIMGLLPRQNIIDRRRIQQDPAVAINYIGAIMHVIAQIAEHRHWSVRDQPGVLTYAYHARDPLSWSRTVATKSQADLFKLPRDMMGGWVAEHLQFLEAAVGKGF